MTADLFTHYWWLIFPVMFMIMGTVRLILRSQYEQKKLDLMRAYVAQGKPVPEALRNDRL